MVGQQGARRLSACAVALAGTLAAGCGGDDGATSANAFCIAMAGPGATVSCSGEAQSIADCAAAFDGNLDSFARLGVSGSTQFQGSAAEQPAGSVAGVHFAAAADIVYSITVSTLQDGVVQETSTPQQFAPGGTPACSPEMDCAFGDERAYVGLTTHLPYDGIQAAITNSGTTDGTGTIAVFELCTR